MCSKRPPAAEVNRGRGAVVLPDVNAPVTNIDPVAPAPPPGDRPEPKARFEARVGKDGTVTIPASLIAPAMAAVLGWWRDQPDTGPQAPLSSSPPSSAPSRQQTESSALAGQTQGVSNVLDGVAALVRAELRAAVVEAISSTVSEPEDTSHLTARELAERLRVHVETIRRWSRQPGFPVRRIGPHAVRFDLVEVRAWRRTAR